MSERFFDHVAQQWDALRATMYSDEVREAALAHAMLHPKAVVADIGAGTGFLALGLAPRVAQVHVVDRSEEMLRQARRNLAAYENVSYHQAEGLHIPLPDESLDAALANMYLHHCEDPAAAIREMVRLLKPGGRVVITDMCEHSFDWLAKEHHDRWLGFPLDTVERWLREAGLVNVLVQPLGERCCASSACGQGEAAVDIFVAAGEKPNIAVQDAVEDHYRRLAVSQSSCCGPASTTCCEPTAGLESQEITLVEGADEVLSLGCGQPVALADLRPGEVVLDIGSGSGADAFPAAMHVGPEGRVIGVDMLPEMLERARRIATERGIRNVEFRQGNALALPVEDEAVDVVISNCVINLVPDKGQAFREAYRVLRPGGRLVISDIVTDRPLSPEMRRNAEAWAACVAGALPESEYIALIRAAGFTDIQAQRSESWGEEGQVEIYSLLVRARKPAAGSCCR